MDDFLTSLHAGMKRKRDDFEREAIRASNLPQPQNEQRNIKPLKANTEQKERNHSKTMSEILAAIQPIIGYEFKDPFLLLEAFQSSGTGYFFAGTEQVSMQGNLRLALVGDAWLRTIVLKDWFPTGLTTGEASRLIATVQCNANLNHVGQFYGFDRFISSGYTGGKRVADTVEAVVGAVAEDTGGDMKILKDVMERIGLIPRTDSSGQLRGIVHL